MFRIAPMLCKKAIHITLGVAEYLQHEVAVDRFCMYVKSSSTCIPYKEHSGVM